MPEYFPKESFTKRFATKKQSQFNSDTGYMGPLDPPEEEQDSPAETVGPSYHGNSPEFLLKRNLNGLIDQYGWNAVSTALDKLGEDYQPRPNDLKGPNGGELLVSGN